MAKFAIRITETLARTVIVDSDDLDEAIQKVEKAESSLNSTKSSPYFAKIFILLSAPKHF